MSEANKKQIKEHVSYMKALMVKIEQAANDYKEDAYQSRQSGTIKNLAPELAKASSQLKQMMCCGYKS